MPFQRQSTTYKAKLYATSYLYTHNTIVCGIVATMSSSAHVLQRQSPIAPAAGTSTCSGAQCPCIRQVTSTTTHLAAAPPLTHLQCAQSRSMQSPLTKWFCTQSAGAATCRRVGSSNMQASTTSSTYLLRIFNNDVDTTFSTFIDH